MTFDTKKRLIEKYQFAFYVFFVAGFFFLPTRWLRNYFYIFIILPFMLELISGYKKFLSSTIFLSCLIYCLYMVASLGWGDGVDLDLSIYYLRRAFTVLCFLAITIHLFSTRWERFESLLKYLCWTAGIMAIISSIWYGFSQGYFSAGSRMINLGILDYPNSAGYGYAMIAVIAFIKFFNSDECTARDRTIYFLVILLSVTFVFLTQCRGALLALIAVLLGCVLLFKPIRAVWVLGLLPLSFAVAVLFGGFKISYLTERADSFRLTIWRQGWEIFSQKPVLGHGLGGARPPIVFEHGIASSSHNLFLSNMVDGGVIALLLLLVFLGLAAYRAFQFFFKTKNVALLALIGFSILANITDGKMLIGSPGYQWLLFWLPVGIVAAYELHSRRDAQIVCSGS